MSGLWNLETAMKSTLRAILGWLERKSPDKVVVTQKDYDRLDARLKYLEAEVSKFNVSLGFGAGRAPANGQAGVGASPFQR